MQSRSHYWQKELDSRVLWPLLFWGSEKVLLEEVMFQVSNASHAKAPSIRGSLVLQGKGGQEAAEVSWSQGAREVLILISWYIEILLPGEQGESLRVVARSKIISLPSFLSFFVFFKDSHKLWGERTDGDGEPAVEAKDQSWGCYVCQGKRCWWPWGQANWMGWLIQGPLESVLGPRQNGPREQELWLTISHQVNLIIKI